MAIVFISAKQKQQSFIWGVAILLMLVLAGGALALFLPGFLNPDQVAMPMPGPGQLSDVVAAPVINFSVIDSQKVQDLQLFSIQENVFAYTVTDKQGKKITGNIFSKTKQEAQGMLEAAGYKVISVDDMAVGRAEPFVSY